MPLRIFNNKLVLRNGDLALTEECCTCCLCEDTEGLEEICGIDYIAVEIEICMETCRDDNGDYRSCPGDAWTVTLELNGANGFVTSGYIKTNAPAGANELLPIGDSLADDFVLEIDASVVCGLGFQGDGVFIKQPILANDIYYIQVKLALYDKNPVDRQNCIEGGLNLFPDNPVSYCRGGGATPFESFFALPLAMKKEAEDCCPEVPPILKNFVNPELNSALSPFDPGNFPNVLEYKFCDGFVFKFNSVTIVYL